MKRRHPMLSSNRAICHLALVSLSAGFLAIVLSIPGNSTAADDGASDAGVENASQPVYERDVRPILEAKCFRCHGPESQKGDLALHLPAAVLKGSENGPIVVPGKADESRLLEVLLSGEMPPDKKQPLSDDEISIVRKWIEAGARFDAPSVAPKSLTDHDVIPILLLRCAACHGSRKQEGGLDVRTRESLIKGGKSGPAIVPGKPLESLLVQRIQAEAMPPRQRLTEVSVKPVEPAELDKLIRWIETDAPAAQMPVDKAGALDDPLVRPEDREFWSFQSPRFMSPPTVQPIETESFANDPIDQFLLEKLHTAGLRFNREADRYSLLRRASLDLTGIPLDVDTIEAFASDDRPDSFERQIDKLLASPRYGERWGRHWLDVAGYADCEGRREQHLPRPVAWRYRDYVIRSFNSDKPYSRFLTEQLAGDELVDIDHAAVITQEMEDNVVATAFLHMAPDPTWANLTGFVPDRLEVMADEMDVLTSGVMGLTFKCARCHSHKFDPIPQRDYYRLVAIFKGALDEHNWLKPELNGFGGALSAGFGDRYVHSVTTREHDEWQKRVAELDQQIQSIKDGANGADVTKQIQALEAKKPPKPRIMALIDYGDPSPTFIYRRGDYLTPGEFVQPGVPAVLTNGEPFSIAKPWPDAKSTGRRLAFAKWLTRPEHPLTARVYVNRIWKHHFGIGIVRTLGNFGKTGERPTHPALLDRLAYDFVSEGFSTKRLHRRLLTTFAYRQSSVVGDEQDRVDPDNRLLSRMPLGRMEAEVMRDTLMSIAGELDETAFGPPEPVTVHPDGLVTAGRRRSIYAQQLRKHVPSLLESFDLPAMNPNCLQRSESLVATQALHLWNDSQVRELAKKLAARVVRETVDPKSQLEVLYRITLGRPPSHDELEACQKTLVETESGQSPAQGGKTDEASAAGHLKALTLVAHTLMNSASFVYID